MTTIGDYAFRMCTSLTSITIPNSVTSIGDVAFDGCSALANISIGSGVTHIGYGAFNNTAYYEKETNWEDGVLYIGNCLIEADTSISGSYTIKAGTTVIAAFAFYNRTSLTSINIPDSVTSIGDWAFYNCTSLTSVIIPDSVTTIGNSAFYGCTLLTSVTFENTSGWYFTASEGAASGTDILSSDLSSTSTAATYLKDTYPYFYWYRSES